MLRPLLTTPDVGGLVRAVRVRELANESDRRCPHGARRETQFSPRTATRSTDSRLVIEEGMIFFRSCAGARERRVRSLAAAGVARTLWDSARM